MCFTISCSFFFVIGNVEVLSYVWLRFFSYGSLSIYLYLVGSGSSRTHFNKFSSTHIDEEDKSKKMI